MLRSKITVTLLLLDEGCIESCNALFGRFLIDGYFIGEQRQAFAFSALCGICSGQAARCDAPDFNMATVGVPDLHVR